MSPPKPRISSTVLPACRESMTPATCSGMYRMQEFAVFDVSGPSWPSARMRKRKGARLEALEALRRWRR